MPVDSNVDPSSRPSESRAVAGTEPSGLRTSSRRRRRVRLGLASSAALVLVLSACGGSPAAGGDNAVVAAPVAALSTADPVQFLEDVATRTTEAGSVRIAFDASGTVDGKAWSMKVTGQAEEDPAKAGYVVTGAVPMGAGLTGAAAGSAATPVSMEVRVLDGYVYLTAVGLPTPGWVKVSMEQAKAVAAERAAAAGATPGVDQAKAEAVHRAVLEALQKSTTVRALGTDTVDGTAVATYSVDVDPERLVAALPAGAVRDKAEAMFEGAKDRVPAELALDEQGRLRRLSTAASGVTPAANTAAGSVAQHSYDSRVVVTMSGFGEPVDVVAPETAFDVGGMLPMLAERLSAQARKAG